MVFFGFWCASTLRTQTAYGHDESTLGSMTVIATITGEMLGICQKQQY